MIRTSTIADRNGAAELKSVALFVGVLLVLESATAMLSGTAALDWLSAVTARAAGVVAGLTGASASVAGAQVSLPSRTLYVNAECTGVFLLSLFVALVLASPASVSSKMSGLLVGIPAILAANLARLVLVVQISGFDGAAFAFLHDYLFQGCMLLVVLGSWAFWLARMARGEVG